MTSRNTGSVSRKLNLSLRETACPPFAADGGFADMVESNGCCESIVSMTLFMWATVDGSKKFSKTITARCSATRAAYQQVTKNCNDS